MDELPKPPPSAVSLFITKNRDKLKAENPTLSDDEITKKLAEKFASVSDEEKAPFLKEAEKLKRQHDKETELYLARNPDVRLPRNPISSSAAAVVAKPDEEVDEKEVDAAFVDIFAIIQQKTGLSFNPEDAKTKPNNNNKKQNDDDAPAF